VAFRRKQRRSREVTELSKLDATPPWETRIRDEPAATSGPYDERDAPADDIPRADLGCLRIPIGAGLDLQLEVNENKQVVSATLAAPDGTMQLGLFAAPRNEGIWEDVRGELATSLREQRGNPKERHDGAFGVELTATIAGPNGRLPVRFIGVDGPRWFLRAMLAGAAADPARAERFEKLLRQVVVVRGTEPLPVRDPVPLELPKDVELPEELRDQPDEDG
jgi:Protein of unknown function (DUF3710)